VETDEQGAMGVGINVVRKDIEGRVKSDKMGEEEDNSSKEMALKFRQILEN
jgi:hypothetical protein